MEFESKRKSRIKPARPGLAKKAESEDEDEDEHVNVEVKNVEPLRVDIADFDPPEPPEPIKTKSGEMSLPPTTTEQQDIVTAGQRFTSNIWELTQSAVTLIVTLTVAYMAILGIDNAVIQNSFFLIIGFYFARSNHQAIGGVGAKATDFQKYVGR